MSTVEQKDAPKLPDGAIVDPANGAVTIRLEWPIKSEGEEIDTLTIRRLKYGTLKQCGEMGSVKMLGVVLRDCAGLAPSSIDQLDQVDLEQVGQVIGFFSVRRPKGSGAT